MKLLIQKYASIIFVQNEKAKTHEAVLKELEQLRDILYNNLPLIKILNSPVIAMGNKQELMERIFKGIKFKPNLICSNLLTLLLRDNNFNLFKQIVETYQNLITKSQNIIKAEVTFALKPSVRELGAIEKLLKERFNYSCELAVKIDPAIIGGFIIEFEGYRLDNSLKNLISEFKQKAVA